MVAGAFSGLPGYRGTEDSLNRRVTEAGDDRLIQEPNAFKGSFAADGTRIAFSGYIQAKNSTTWQVPATSVNDGGTWKTPLSAYYFNATLWKRIL